LNFAIPLSTMQGIVRRYGICVRKVWAHAPSRSVSPTFLFSFVPARLSRARYSAPSFLPRRPATADGCRGLGSPTKKPCVLSGAGF
jgi:hypothetical protein